MDSKLTLDGRRYIREFYSWSAMLGTATGPCDLSNRGRMSRSNRESFCNGVSFDEAVRMAEYGWQEGLDNLIEVEEDYILHLPSTRIDPLPEYDVYGDTIDVGEFCAGIPENMVRYDRNAYSKAVGSVYDIVVNVSVSGGVGSDVIYNRGAALYYLVSVMEKFGIATAITIQDTARAEGPDGRAWEYIVTTPLKTPSSVIDPGNLIYALGHETFLRRLMFSVEECEPAEVRRIFEFYATGGYGIPIDVRVSDCDLYFGTNSIRWFSTRESSVSWLRKKLSELSIPELAI